MLDDMKVSLSGVEADDEWMQTISNNLANAQTVNTPQGGPYLRETVAFEQDPDNGGVKVAQVYQENRTPELRYEPSSPFANAQGMVAYPNIDLAQEMSELDEAAQAYRANAVALANAKDMMRDALQI